MPVTTDGGASGIGAETVRVLAVRGARVIIAARNLKAASDAKQLILKDNGAARVEILKLDLSSLKSVREFVDGFLAMDLPLNILMPFLSTNLLLEKMKSTARETGIEGRIVNLSSIAHSHSYIEGIRFNKINYQSGYSDKKVYGQSKLTNILHSNELSQRLQAEGINVTANSVHPGLIMTNLMGHSFLLMNILKVFTYYLWKNVPQGAATTCYLALHPSLKGASEKYFIDCNEFKPSTLARNKALGKKLWLQ